MSIIIEDIPRQQHLTFDEVCNALQTFQTHRQFALSSEKDDEKFSILAEPNGDQGESIHRIKFLITENEFGRVSINQRRFWNDGYAMESRYDLHFVEVLPVIETTLSLIVYR